VIELEAIESVLQAPYRLAVSFHLGVMAARLLHYLIDDELRVSSDVEALDP
jgi:hypothetical protein